ncbi:MAG: nucleoside monophosphate kinase [Patescibacteria group bacterium]
MEKIIVLYGLPAAGKTTQAEIIHKKYNLYQFGMGDKLRAEIAAGTELGKKIEATVASGQLIPDDLMAKVLQNVKNEAQAGGIVFDGFPRIMSQAKLLDEMLSEINLEVDLFVLLKISPEEAARRISARAEHGARNDDNDPEAVKRRFAVFQKESIPLIAHYKARGKYLEVDGEASIPEVFAAIEKHGA